MGKSNGSGWFRGGSHPTGGRILQPCFSLGYFLSTSRRFRRSRLMFMSLRFLHRRSSLAMFSVLLSGVLLASGGLMSAAGDSRGEIDLTESVRVEFATSLRRVARDGYEVSARLKNSTDAALRGPLVLVIDGTGLDELTVRNAGGQLESGKPWIEFVPAGEVLAAGESTAEVTIPFQTEDRLSLGQRRKFDLDYRVVQLPERKAEEPLEAKKQERGNGFVGAPGKGQPGQSQPSGGKGEQPGEPKPFAGSEPAAAEEIPEEEIVRNDEPRIDRPIPSDREVARVVKVQDEWNRRLMNREGVHGVATGMNAKGDAIVVVYVERAGFVKLMPESVGGVPVKTRVLSPIRPFAPPPQDKVVHIGSPPDQSVPADCVDNPQEQSPFPIPIGSSVGHVDITAGTIGCLVRDRNGNPFGLTNNHVGANSNAALIGDAIQHPGPTDAGSTDPIYQIGTLIDFEPIDFAGTNIIDASLIKVQEGILSNSGPCYGYVIPRETPVEPVLGLKVQKLGRTTRHTRGFVSEVNVTVNVNFGVGIAQFVDQVGFQADLANGSYISLGAPGDSGSLIVTNPGRSPVALLFAGGGLDTFGNPIDAVLERFDVRIDGIRDGGR